LEDRQVEVGQRVVLLPVEGQVLTMPEATSCQEHRHVAIIVTGGVSKIARQQHAGLIQKGAAIFLHCLERPQEITPGIDDRFFNNRQLCQLFVVTAVMAERVIPLVYPFQWHHPTTPSEMAGDKSR